MEVVLGKPHKDYPTGAPCPRTMPDYGLIGKFDVAPGKRGELVDILLEAARLMEGAAGCKQYVVHEPVTDADEVWVTEIWTSRNAHDASLGLPGVRELIARAMPLIASAATSVETTPRGGVGA